MTARWQSHLARAAAIAWRKTADPVSFIFGLGNVAMAAVMIWTIGLVLVGDSAQYLLGVFVVFFEATAWVTSNVVLVALRGVGR